MSGRNAFCTACPLFSGAKTVCLWGEGDPEAEVLVIGEAPGREEDNSGRPFVGQSGKLIREELRRAGFNSVYITNVAKCRPPDNRTPTAKEAKACRQYLDEEIRRIKPKYVIALGALASKTVLKRAKITEAHGQLVELPGFTGMPVYHPAYALRDPSKLPAIQYDLARLRRAIDGTEPEDKFNWKLIDSVEAFEDFLAEFQRAEEFSFDKETSGLFPHDRKGHVRCLGIGLPGRAWVFPLDMPGSHFDGKPDLVRMVGYLLRYYARGKESIAQNGKFDNEWGHYYLGGGFYLDFDTMLAHHILDENQPHDLKYMARMELDCPDYDISTKEKRGGNLHTPQGRQAYWEYCARDAWNTLYLKRRFAKRIRESLPLRRLFYSLVMPASRVLEKVEMEGLTLDLPRYAKTEEEARTKRDGLARQLHKISPKTNWNSPAQVAKVLFEDLGLKSTVKTGKGAPSTGESALVDLKGKHPVADTLISFRETEKFIGTYLEGWKEFIVDGKLYLGYKLHGTVTGRYSSRLHQVPRDGSIRNLVIAPEGWEFVQADLSQAELRIAAELSGDLELISCFRPGGADVHWRTMLHIVATGASSEYDALAKSTAAKLSRSRHEPRIVQAVEILSSAGHEACIAIDKTWKEARKRGKSLNFGFVFGMYENKFIETCKTKYGYEPTWEEAHAFRQAYFELYQGVPKWHDKQKRLVRIHGEVSNLFGRVRRLPGIYSSDRSLRSECERQAINSPVQGAIGDWKAAAMIEIDERLDRNELRIVGEHHDALLMIVRKGCEDRTLPTVRSIMRKPRLLETFKIKMSVPMDSSLELGAWGNGKEYKGDL
jgi:uracil-DNA glycosylase family 4